MTPRLSIVIVNFNAREHLERCLASLAADPPQAAFEIIVVDNGSSDGSAEMLRGRPGVVFVPLGKNVGFSAGNNAGIARARGELLLLLNSDTVVPHGALDRLIARLDAHPRAAIAGPRLVDDEGKAELSFGRMISPLAELRQKLLGALYARRVGAAVRRIEAMTRREQQVDWVSGACLLVRHDVAREAGGLDERFFLYTEDVDFCASVRALGWQVLFTPAAEVVHSRGRSRASAPGAASAAYRRSHLAFYEKHHPRWAPALRLYLRLKRQLP